VAWQWRCQNKPYRNNRVIAAESIKKSLVQITGFYRAGSPEGESGSFIIGFMVEYLVGNLPFLPNLHKHP
jgi:hypothetical protein